MKIWQQDRMEKCKSLRIEIDGKTNNINVFSPSKIGPNRNKNAKGKNPRSTRIDMSFKSEVSIEKVLVAKDMSKVNLLGKRYIVEVIGDYLVPDNSEIYHFYKGSSKERILSAAFFKYEIPPAHIDALLRRCSHVYGIDTNTRKIKGAGDVSLSVTFESGWDKISKDFSTSRQSLFEMEAYLNVRKPENFAWARLIKRLEKIHAESSLRNIGVIVDSDFGNLRKYNYRELPIYDDFYLPEGFRLIYAKSDSGSEEYLANRIIRLCDNAANYFFKSIEIDSSGINIDAELMRNWRKNNGY